MRTKTLMGHDHSVSGVVYLPDGEHVASSSRDATVRIWEVRTGYCVRTLSGHGDWARKVACSHDGTLLASCSNDHSVRVWHTKIGGGASKNENLACVLRGHDHVVECVAFANLARCSLRNGHGGGVKGQASATPATVSEKYFVATVPDGYVSDGPTAQCIMTFTNNENWVQGLCTSGKYIISAAEDRSIRVYLEKRCVRTISGAHDHFLTCIAAHTSGSLVISGSVDKTVKLWNCR